MLVLVLVFDWREWGLVIAVAALGFSACACPRHVTAEIRHVTVEIRHVTIEIRRVRDPMCQRHQAVFGVCFLSHSPLSFPVLMWCGDG